MVLEDVVFELTHSCAEIKLSVEASGSGQYKMSRDFLVRNSYNLDSLTLMCTLCVVSFSAEWEMYP